MKPWLAMVILAGCFEVPAIAQYDIPMPPGVNMKPRTTGGGQGGVEVIPRDGSRQKQRITTHLILSELRSWTSTEGKVLEAKLLAFEDLVLECIVGEAAPANPEPPAQVTVVRDGKVRLLVGGKAVELALSRLSQEDRDFIERVRKVREAAP